MIDSQLDVNAEAFTNNHEALFDEISRVEATAELIQRGGSEKSRERHLSRGKLLPRERIEYLIDPGTAFLEVGLFAAYAVSYTHLRAHETPEPSRMPSSA